MEELTKVEYTVCSFIPVGSDDLVIQVTIGNYLPEFGNDTILHKLFVCADQDEMTKCLAMLFQDREMRLQRSLQ